jgi:hypothetical protein
MHQEQQFPDFLDVAVAEVLVVLEQMEPIRLVEMVVLEKNQQNRVYRLPTQLHIGVVAVVVIVVIQTQVMVDLVVVVQAVMLKVENYRAQMDMEEPQSGQKTHKQTVAVVVAVYHRVVVDRVLVGQE